MSAWFHLRSLRSDAPQPKQTVNPFTGEPTIGRAAIPAGDEQAMLAVLEKHELFEHVDDDCYLWAETIFEPPRPGPTIAIYGPTERMRAASDMREDDPAGVVFRDLEAAWRDDQTVFLCELCQAGNVVLVADEGGDLLWFGPPRDDLPDGATVFGPEADGATITAWLSQHIED